MSVDAHTYTIFTLPPAELADFRGFTGKCSSLYLEIWWKVYCSDQTLFEHIYYGLFYSS